MIVDVNPGTAVATILSVLAGAGLWVRKERSSWAKNNEFVAQSKLTTEVARGELSYLTKVHEELNELRRTVLVHTNKIASLESLYVPIKQHVGNLTLCEPCQENNKQILNAINQALSKVAPEEEDYGHKH